MLRPCFLVLDPEHPGSISTRKLVIETAKFNVLTAYSAAEAIETLKSFPAIHAAVVDARTHDMPPDRLIQELRRLKSDLPIVVIAAPGQQNPHGADHIVNSLEPRALLDILQVLCPAESKAIAKHDRDLEASGQ